MTRKTLLPLKCIYCCNTVGGKGVWEGERDERGRERDQKERRGEKRIREALSQIHSLSHPHFHSWLFLMERVIASLLSPLAHSCLSLFYPQSTGPISGHSGLLHAIHFILQVTCNALSSLLLSCWGFYCTFSFPFSLLLLLFFSCLLLSLVFYSHSLFSICISPTGLIRVSGMKKLLDLSCTFFFISIYLSRERWIYTSSLSHFTLYVSQCVCKRVTWILASIWKQLCWPL